MSDTVYVTPNGEARSNSRVYHTDRTCPRLNAAREADRDSLDDRFTECRECAGLAEQPTTHRQSLRARLAADRRAADE